MNKEQRDFEAGTLFLIIATVLAIIAACVIVQTVETIDCINSGQCVVRLK